MNKQLPKSASNKPCISLCVEKGKQIKHPVTGSLIVSNDASYCAVDPVYENGKIVVIDECDTKQNPTNIDAEILTSLSNPDLLNPVSQFNPRYFLMFYYNISTINDLYKWFASNKNAPVLTRTRIVDLFLLSIRDNAIFFDETFVDIFIQLIKQFWIKVIYKKLCPYVGVVNGKGILTIPEKNTLKKMENNDIRAKFIVNEIFDKSKLVEMTGQYTDKMIKTETQMSFDSYLQFIVIELEKSIQNELGIEKQKTKKPIKKK